MEGLSGAPKGRHSNGDSDQLPAHAPQIQELHRLLQEERAARRHNELRAELRADAARQMHELKAAMETQMARLEQARAAEATRGALERRLLQHQLEMQKQMAQYMGTQFKNLASKHDSLAKELGALRTQAETNTSQISQMHEEQSAQRLCTSLCTQTNTSQISQPKKHGMVDPHLGSSRPDGPAGSVNSPESYPSLKLTQ